MDELQLARQRLTKVCHRITRFCLSVVGRGLQRSQRQKHETMTAALATRSSRSYCCRFGCCTYYEYVGLYREKTWRLNGCRCYCCSLLLLLLSLVLLLLLCSSLPLFCRWCYRCYHWRLLCFVSLLVLLVSLFVDFLFCCCFFFFSSCQSLAERDAEVSKLRTSATALEVELQRKTMDLGALQRQVWLCSADFTLVIYIYIIPGMCLFLRIPFTSSTWFTPFALLTPSNFHFTRFSLHFAFFVLPFTSFSLFTSVISFTFQFMHCIHSIGLN